MLDALVGDAIAATATFTGVAYETIDARSVRVIIEAPEFGRHLFIDVTLDSDDSLAVLRLATVRCIDGDLEPPTEVIDQALKALRQRWPEIVVHVRDAREGVHVEYEAIVVRRPSADPAAREELAKDFVTLLPRLRDCVVRSFRFMNVLCMTSQLDVRLLEAGQDFALPEWEFVQACGGLESLKNDVQQLCDLLRTSKDSVLAAAIAALRDAQAAEAMPTALQPPEPVIPQAAVDHGQPPVVFVQPIGLTLEELISFGP